MKEHLEYLEKWVQSKSKIFACEEFDVSVSDMLGQEIIARYIEIHGNGLLCRATVWENGDLVLEAIELQNETQVIQKRLDSLELWQLDEKLNWWLSEIAIYEQPKALQRATQMTFRHKELIKFVLPLWYAQISWAKELLIHGFGLEKAEDILNFNNRGFRQVSGTAWYIRTHGIGVDVFKTPEVGGIDFDFDKHHPDAWRLRIFIEKQVNDGNLSYSLYKELIDDEELMKAAIAEVLGQ